MIFTMGKEYSAGKIKVTHILKGMVDTKNYEK